MADNNEVKFSGTIHKLYRLKTKAGAPMVKLLLQVGKDTFWVLSYGNVADAIMALKEGDPLAITGTAQMNNWKDEAGDWHNDFNAVAWAVEIDGQKVKYEKSEPAKQQRTSVGSRKPQQRSIPDHQAPLSQHMRNTMSTIKTLGIRDSSFVTRQLFGCEGTIWSYCKV